MWIEFSWDTDYNVSYSTISLPDTILFHDTGYINRFALLCD